MTLDEHIKRAEEDAAQAESDSDWGIGNYFIDQTEALEYAKNCRQLVKWLKDYKRLLESESSYNSIRNELKQEACKGNIYLTKEAYGELCYKASKWNEVEMCEDCISRQAVKEPMIKYGFHAPDMTITEFVESLPPVTP